MARKKSQILVASVAAFDPEGKLLFGLRSDMNRWVLPGGHVEEGEDPIEAAVRELLEETGLRPKALEYLGHGIVRRLPGDIRVYCFRAQVDGEPHGKNDPDQECQTFRFVSTRGGIPDDIVQHLRDRNNVTLRLLGLQDGEVRKFETAVPESQTLQKAEPSLRQLLHEPPPTWTPGDPWEPLDSDSKEILWRTYFHQLGQTQDQHRVQSVPSPGWRFDHSRWNQLDLDDKLKYWGKSIHYQNVVDAGRKKLLESPPSESQITGWDWSLMPVQQRWDAWKRYYHDSGITYDGDTNAPIEGPGTETLKTVDPALLQDLGLDNTEDLWKPSVWATVPPEARRQIWGSYWHNQYAAERAKYPDPPPGSEYGPIDWKQASNQGRKQNWLNHYLKVGRQAVMTKPELETEPPPLWMSTGRDWQDLHPDAKAEAWGEHLWGTAKARETRLWGKPPPTFDPVQDWEQLFPTVPERRAEWMKYWQEYHQGLDKPPAHMTDVYRDDTEDTWAKMSTDDRHRAWAQAEQKLRDGNYDLRSPPPTYHRGRDGWQNLSSADMKSAWQDYRTIFFPHLEVNYSKPPTGWTPESDKTWGEHSFAFRRRAWKTYEKDLAQKDPPPGLDDSLRERWSQMAFNQKAFLWKQFRATAHRPELAPYIQDENRKLYLDIGLLKPTDVDEMQSSQIPADRKLALRLPGVTRAHLYEALRDRDTVGEALQHPLLDDRHKHWAVQNLDLNSVLGRDHQNSVFGPEHLTAAVEHLQHQIDTNGATWAAHRDLVFPVLDHPRVDPAAVTRLAAIGHQNPVVGWSRQWGQVWKHPQMPGPALHDFTMSVIGADQPPGENPKWEVLDSLSQNPNLLPETVHALSDFALPTASYGSQPAWFKNIAGRISSPDIAKHMRNLSGKNGLHNHLVDHMLANPNYGPDTLAGIQFTTDTNRDFLSRVLGSPKTNPSLLESVARSLPHNEWLDDNSWKSLFSNPALAPETVNHLVAEHGNRANPHTMVALAHARGLSPESADKLLDETLAAASGVDAPARQAAEAFQNLMANPVTNRSHAMKAIMTGSRGSAIYAFEAAARRPELALTPDDIQTLLQHQDPGVRLQALNQPGTTSTQLGYAISHPEQFPDAYWKGYDKTLGYVLRGDPDAPVFHPRLTGEHVRQLIASPNPRLRMVGLRHPTATIQDLESVINDSDYSRGLGLASHPSLSPDQQMRLLHQQGRGITKLLLNNPNLDPAVLGAMTAPAYEGLHPDLLAHPRMPSSVVDQQLDQVQGSESMYRLLQSPAVSMEGLTRFQDRLEKLAAPVQDLNDPRLQQPPHDYSSDYPTEAWVKLRPEFRRDVWNRALPDYTRVREALAKKLQDVHPDSVYKKSVQVRPGLQKIRKIRDLIQNKTGKPDGSLSPKLLPPGDWAPGRLPDGNISAKKLDDYIQAQPVTKYNYSHSRWTGLQRHSDEPSKVFQVNLTTDMVQRMKSAGVYNTFKKLQDVSMQSGHPVRPQTLGWVRWTGDKAGVFVDEIQSDFGQSFSKQAAAAAAAEAEQNGLRGDAAVAHVNTRVQHINKELPPEHYEAISKILFGGKHSNAVLHEAFLQYLRDRKWHQTPVHIHSVESKAPISLGRHDLKAKPAPVHFQETYGNIPKKMGYEPATYGQIPTQKPEAGAEHEVPPGAPTLMSPVRKTELDQPPPSMGIEDGPWAQSDRSVRMAAWQTYYQQLASAGNAGARGQYLYLPSYQDQDLLKEHGLQYPIGHEQWRAMPTDIRAQFHGAELHRVQTPPPHWQDLDRWAALPQASRGTEWALHDAIQADPAHRQQIEDEFHWRRIGHGVSPEPWPDANRFHAQVSSTPSLDRRTLQDALFEAYIDYDNALVQAVMAHPNFDSRHMSWFAAQRPVNPAAEDSYAYIMKSHPKAQDEAVVSAAVHMLTHNPGSVERMYPLIGSLAVNSGFQPKHAKILLDNSLGFKTAPFLKAGIPPVSKVVTDHINDHQYLESVVDRLLAPDAQHPHHHQFILENLLKSKHLWQSEATAEKINQHMLAQIRMYGNTPLDGPAKALFSPDTYWNLNQDQVREHLDTAADMANSSLSGGLSAGHENYLRGLLGNSPKLGGNFVASIVHRPEFWDDLSFLLPTIGDMPMPATVAKEVMDHVLTQHNQPFADGKWGELSFNSRDFLRNLTQNSVIKDDPSLLTAMAKHPNPFVKTIAAATPNLPDEGVQALIEAAEASDPVHLSGEDEDQDYVEALASNGYLSDHSVRTMAASANDRVAMAGLDHNHAFGRNPGAVKTPEDLEPALTHRVPQVRLYALAQAGVTPEQLHRAIKDPELGNHMVSAPVCHEALKAKGMFGLDNILHTLNCGEGEAAFHPALRPEHLPDLLAHSNLDVQSVALRHPRLPAEYVDKYLDQKLQEYGAKQYRSRVGFRHALETVGSLNQEQQSRVVEALASPDPAGIDQGSVLSLLDRPDVTPTTLTQVYHSPLSQNSAIKFSLSGHEDLPVAIIEDMIAQPDLDPNIADSLMRLPNVGLDIVKKLSQRVAQAPDPHNWNQVRTLINEKLGDHDPDSVYSQKVMVRPGLQKIRKIRDIIVDRTGSETGSLSPKLLPPGDWGMGRDPKTGNISAARLQAHIDAQPAEPFNLSATTYGHAQLHSKEPSQVLQVNLSTPTVQRLHDAGVWNTFKNFYEYSKKSGHPVTPHSLGWIRYTGDQNGVFIDEIQSDFGQKLLRLEADEKANLARHAKEYGWTPEYHKEKEEAGMKLLDEKFPKDHRQKIHEILLGGKPSGAILHEAFLQHLRDRGWHNTPVHIHSVESKAPISLGNREKEEPVHMKQTYGEIPKKMGYEPATYGVLPTQANPAYTHLKPSHGPAAPTWGSKVRKTETP